MRSRRTGLLISTKLNARKRLALINTPIATRQEALDRLQTQIRQHRPGLSRTHSPTCVLRRATRIGTMRTRGSAVRELPSLRFDVPAPLGDASFNRQTHRPPNCFSLRPDLRDARVAFAVFGIVPRWASWRLDEQPARLEVFSLTQAVDVLGMLLTRQARHRIENAPLVTSIQSVWVSQSECRASYLHHARRQSV